MATIKVIRHYGFPTIHKLEIRLHSHFILIQARISGRKLGVNNLFNGISYDIWKCVSSCQFKSITALQKSLSSTKSTATMLTLFRNRSPFYKFLAMNSGRELRYVPLGSNVWNRVWRVARSVLRNCPEVAAWCFAHPVSRSPDKPTYKHFIGRNRDCDWNRPESHGPCSDVQWTGCTRWSSAALPPSLATVVRWDRLTRGISSILESPPRFRCSTRKTVAVERWRHRSKSPDSLQFALEPGGWEIRAPVSHWSTDDWEWVIVPPWNLSVEAQVVDQTSFQYCPSIACASAWRTRRRRWSQGWAPPWGAIRGNRATRSKPLNVLHIAEAALICPYFARSTSAARWRFESRSIKSRRENRSSELRFQAASTRPGSKVKNRKPMFSSWKEDKDMPVEWGWGTDLETSCRWRDEPCPDRIGHGHRPVDQRRSALVGWDSMWPSYVSLNQGEHSRA